MVKPPKNMEPEQVDLKKPSRAAVKAFEEDSFRNYMARKIDLQRKQFGVELPPDPRIQQQFQQRQKQLLQSPPKQPQSLFLSNAPNQRKSPKRNQHVSFAQDVVDYNAASRVKKRRNRGSIDSILKKLKRRHGKGLKQDTSTAASKKSGRDRVQEEKTGDQQDQHFKTSIVDFFTHKLARGDDSPEQNQSSQDGGHSRQHDAIMLQDDQSQQQPAPPTLRQRPDLFFMGVVIMINGYTNPDTQTLQRLMHRHGGDLEKYETSRITHIIAEHLSFAKAKIYKSRRKPIPVCRPSWIVDSVQAQRLLPYGDYLIDEVRDKEKGETRINDFFSVAITATSVLRGRALSDHGHEFSQVKQNGNCRQERHDYRSPDKQPLLESNNLMDESKPTESGNSEILSQKKATDDAEASNSPSSSPVLELMDELPDYDGQSKPCLDRKDWPVSSTIGPAEVDKVHKSIPKRKVQGRKWHDIECSGENHEAQKSGDGRLEDLNGVGADADDTSACEHNSENVSHSQRKPSNEKQPDHDSSAKNEDKKSLVQHPLIGRTDDKYINGHVRTTGTDPKFLETFFSNSRLSFIGSYKQRTKGSPTKKGRRSSRCETQRFVMHCDMDCFFAMVALRNYPQFQNKPVAISHFGKMGGQQNEGQPKKNSSSECATCNYEARKFGIKKGMFLGQAKELCPDLIVLPYDFQGYQEVSQQVADILHRLADEFDGEVEQVSCDESYLELHIPKAKGSDPCRDAGDIANDVRKTILATTRCTATVGVAENKFLAKLATDRVKPNGSFVVRNPTELLRTLKLRDLHGVGYRTEPKLAAEGLVSVEDVWDLGEAAEGALCRVLGPGLGQRIVGFCNGQDTRPVKAAERKTIGAEVNKILHFEESLALDVRAEYLSLTTCQCNYGVRFDGPYGVDHMITELAKEVHKRMQAVGVYGGRVTLKMKQRKEGAKAPVKFLGHGSCHNLSKSMDTTAGATRDWNMIGSIATTLFRELGVPADEIRGMGLVVSKLSGTNEESNRVPTSNQSITNWFGSDSGPHQRDLPKLMASAKTSDIAFTKGGRATCDPPTPVDWSSNEDVLPDERFDEIPSEHHNEVARDSAIARDAAEPLATNQEIEGIFDVELPSMSQLHMSQVAALPVYMQNLINRTIAERTKTSIPSRTGISQPSTRDSADDGHDRLRQVSVKRLFRLQTVKSGKGACENGEGNTVAVRELECLPLKMQLQLANNDQCAIGSRPRKKRTRSTETKGRASISRKRRPPSSVPINRSISSDDRRSPRKQPRHTTKKHDRLAKVKHQYLDNLVFASQSADSPLRDSFYEDEICPLSAFLDNHQEPDPESLSHVKCFFAQKIAEHHTYEAMLLLRHICNRRDKWSMDAFRELLQAVDDECQAVEGYRLDREGMGFA